jgi:GNAT superfamily N-acetyltransferase
MIREVRGWENQDRKRGPYVSVTEEFEVKKTTIKEYDHVNSLLKEVAQWLKDNGVKQWGYLLDGGDDQEILQAIIDGYTYIIMEDNGAIATFTLSPEQNEWDQHIFGKDTEFESLYLHRLAVMPDYMKQGIGKRILQWIHENAKHEKKWLKLNCVADNPRLNRFYQENGFDYLGETDSHSKYRMALSNR